MAEDKKQEEMNEESRREFVTKLVTTAGALAAAGLVAGASEAEAQTAVQLHKIDVAGTALFKLGKIERGFRVTISGRQLGSALRNAGLLAEGANVDQAAITIEFTA